MIEQIEEIPLDLMKEKVSYLLPINEIESEALDQIKNVCLYDCVKEIAVMPDVHKGYFLPIGGVALVEGFISPRMVGYDQGCGMCYLDTGEKVRHLLPDKRERIKVMNFIIKGIPIGKGVNHEEERAYRRFVSASGDEELTKKVTNRAGYQIGTLGAGNHFLELGENLKGNVCITIHSGSRNPGWTIADYYMKHGDFLDENSDIGRAYIQDMNWAINYALMNRQMMMYEVLKSLRFKDDKIKKLVGNIINENHNTATKTKEGWLHRKGATPAADGELGVIPGNMGDGVAITIGLGNKEFLKSASHGAGRKFSRNHAKSSLSMDVFEKKMKGIVSNGVRINNLDESPAAYKNFEKVLAYQDKIVVDVIDRVRPLINIKG